MFSIFFFKRSGGRHPGQIWSRKMFKRSFPFFRGGGGDMQGASNYMNVLFQTARKKSQNFVLKIVSSFVSGVFYMVHGYRIELYYWIILCRQMLSQKPSKAAHATLKVSHKAGKIQGKATCSWKSSLKALCCIEYFIVTTDAFYFQLK